MGGKAPISILTDQDAAMGNAIARVFPHTRHRLCLWHIKKKFAEKLGRVYGKRSNFKRAVKKCTRDARSIQDFEDQWASLMQDYGLQDHSWLNHMYDIKKSWIPIYCRDTFFAGMNTTQRSESINSFFGAFVNGSTDLMGFVSKYTYALENIRRVEKHEDNESRNKSRVLLNKDPILSHAAEVYTRAIFKIIAKEVEDVVALVVEQKFVHGDIYTLHVQYKVGSTEEWVVTFNLTSKMGSCDCLLFEFEGVPCKHLMKVFEHFRIYQIPTPIIMNKWCKYAKRSALPESESIETNDCEVVARGVRVSQLCKLAYQVAHQCGESEIGYKKFKDAMFQLSVDAQEINEMLLQQKNMSSLTLIPVVVGTDASVVDDVILENPKIATTKGRKRINQEKGSNVDKGKKIKQGKGSQVDKGGKQGNNERWVGGFEKATRRPKPRRCQTCFNSRGDDHDSRNCPMLDDIANE